MATSLLLILSSYGDEQLDIDPAIYESLTDRNSSQIGDLRVAHVSDIHHYSPTLYNSGDSGFEIFAANNEGRTVLYTGALLEALEADLLNQGVDVVLISGDLSVLGAKETHQDVAAILSGFEDKGLQVFVGPGNHDVNNPDAFRIIGDGTEAVEWTSPENFKAIYDDFGYGESVMSHEESLSYLAYLDEDTALLSLDTAYYQNNEFLDSAAATGVVVFSLYHWVEEAITRARTDGRRVFVMSHHNFLKHYEVDFDLSNFMVNDEGQMLSQLLDAGVELALSGHIHKSDTKTVSIDGKTFTGVATTSLALYPHSYRILGFDKNEAGITTRPLPLPFDEETNKNILAYNRDIGRDRTYYGRMSRFTDGYSRRDAEAITRYFHIANLYAQQGLEAYLPEEVLNSKGARLLEKESDGMIVFMKSLSIDSFPDDWDTIIPLSE